MFLVPHSKGSQQPLVSESLVGAKGLKRFNMGCSSCSFIHRAMCQCHIITRAFVITAYMRDTKTLCGRRLWVGRLQSTCCSLKAYCAFSNILQNEWSDHLLEALAGIFMCTRTCTSKNMMHAHLFTAQPSSLALLATSGKLCKSGGYDVVTFC